MNEHGLIFDIGSLFEYLTKIRDTRKNRGEQYPLPILLILMLLAKLGGEDKPSGIIDWAAGRKEQLMALHVLAREKTPGHMTYRWLPQEMVNPEKFGTWMGAYHRQRLQEGQEIVLSLDGKTLRGTIPCVDMRGTHLLTVYVPQQGLVLVQAEVDHKENEIVVAPLTVGRAGHNIAILNNIAVGLYLRNNLRNLAQARRQSYAQPREALALIVAVQ